MSRDPCLLVFDVDNTLFDWMPYYAHSNAAMLSRVEEISLVPYEVLVRDFKNFISKYGKSDRSFMLQELTSLNTRRTNINMQALSNACTTTFLQRTTSTLVPYDGVRDTLAMIKRHRPQLPIVALTDSPLLEAVWKISMLKLDQYFAGIYGLDVFPLVATGEIYAVFADAGKKYRGRSQAIPLIMRNRALRVWNLSCVILGCVAQSVRGLSM